jgi:hypothetical protein
MNPSSDLLAVQSDKDMNKLFGSMLVDDGARRTSFKNNYRVRQQLASSQNNFYRNIYQLVK